MTATCRCCAGQEPRRASSASKPPHWRIDPCSSRRRLHTTKTRAVVLNTPLNPSASLIGAEDLALIAAQCIQHDCIAISDEVWEHCVFDGARHLSMLAIPGMRDRTIKIGSAGKIFSMTGWKVGFACAAPPLTEAFAKAHQFLTFTTPPMPAGRRRLRPRQARRTFRCHARTARPRP